MPCNFEIMPGQSANLWSKPDPNLNCNPNRNNNPNKTLILTSQAAQHVLQSVQTPKLCTTLWWAVSFGTAQMLDKVSTRIFVTLRAYGSGVVVEPIQGW